METASTKEDIIIDVIENKIAFDKPDYIRHTIATRIDQVLRSDWHFLQIESKIKDINNEHDNVAFKEPEDNDDNLVEADERVGQVNAQTFYINQVLNLV